VVPNPQSLIDSLRLAKHVVVFTGAGVSAESGIPTFRGKQTGLWKESKAEDLATPAGYRRDPSKVWGWYEYRRGLVLRAQPNAAHRAIAEMATKVPRMTLVTQNVDDLHERGGSREVLHLHGRLTQPVCELCRTIYPLPQGNINEAEQGGRIEPPKCPSCRGRIRPGVVWFGEALPEHEWAQAQTAVCTCDVFFCIGTSSLVYPAASLTDSAISMGAVTVQVNDISTSLDSRVSFNLRGQAGVVLPALVKEVWPTA
jgi:NAD-dependent deacetylase